MAARNNPHNNERSNGLAKATQLVNRLISHVNGEVELSASQVQAAKVVIGKYIPDLKAIEHSGPDGKPIETISTIQLIALDDDGTD